MKIRGLVLYGVLALAAACATSPTAPAGVITVTVASPNAPANGALIANLAQPVTLTITNATVTDSSVAVTYTFEVATEAGFTNKVVTRDVTQGAGQTSLKLDALPAGKDYFWHVRATAGDTVGGFSAVLKFTIGPAIIIQPPVLASPASGAAVPTLRPTLTVTNSVHTGPTGAISYKFQIATDSAFNNVVLSATVSEGTNQTSFALTSDLAYKITYFWRAMATDTTNNISSTFAAPSTFVTPDPPHPLWSGAQPPGTNGHAVKGDNWEEQDLVSFGGTHFHSPTLEMKQLFDLMDRGMDPQAAIDWMHDHGYPTDAAYYSSIDVIGIRFVYLALINGRWDVILRGEGE